MRSASATVITALALCALIGLSGCKQERAGTGSGACALETISASPGSPCVDNYGYVEGKGWVTGSP